MVWELIYVGLSRATCRFVGATWLQGQQRARHVGEVEHEVVQLMHWLLVCYRPRLEFMIVIV